jgi:hypothetical protein
MKDLLDKRPAGATMPRREFFSALGAGLSSLVCVAAGEIRLSEKGDWVLLLQKANH